MAIVVKGAREIREGLEGVAAAVDLTLYRDQIGEGFRRYMDDRFRTQGFGSWGPYDLKDRTKKKGERERLYNAFTRPNHADAVLEVEKDRAFLGVTTDYARHLENNPAMKRNIKVIGLEDADRFIVGRVLDEQLSIVISERF